MPEAQTCYLDTSLILNGLLRENESSLWNQRNFSYLTSELTELECRRTLDRIRLQEHLPDAEIATRLTELNLILKAIRIIHLNQPILRRAKAPYSTVVRSLDAIHLATAELTKCRIFATLDKQQAVAAQALGMRVL